MTATATARREEHVVQSAGDSMRAERRGSSDGGARAEGAGATGRRHRTGARARGRAGDGRWATGDGRRATACPSVPAAHKQASGNACKTTLERSANLGMTG